MSEVKAIPKYFTSADEFVSSIIGVGVLLE
jgi:hypothetical protein